MHLARSQHSPTTRIAVGDTSHVVIEAGALPPGRNSRYPFANSNGDIVPFDKHTPGPLPGFGHILRCN